MISGIGGYLIIAFFTFPVERVNHQVYLSIMMAGIISIYYRNLEKPESKSRTFFVLYHAFAVIVIAATTYYAGILLQSEIYVKKIFLAEETKNWNGMITNADKAFTKFTTVDNYSIPIHNYRGLANMKLKKHKQALADFERALGYSPTQVSILKNLAIASSITGNNKMAISYLKQSLEIFPHYEAGLFNLSKVYYLEKEYSQAYVTLLKCNQNISNADYKAFMESLKIRIDTIAK
jgi:tetratricopeptide (TPR) repeat protein